MRRWILDGYQIIQILSFEARPRGNMVDLYSLPTLAESRPRVILNNSTPFTPALVHERLTQVSDPQQIYADRIKGRQILLENPARVSKSKQEADEKRTARKKATQAKKKWSSPVNQTGLWKLKDSETKYATRSV